MNATILQMTIGRAVPIALIAVSRSGKGRAVRKSSGDASRSGDGGFADGSCRHPHGSSDHAGSDHAGGSDAGGSDEGGGDGGGGGSGGD